jgi:hypothetical protein
VGAVAPVQAAARDRAQARIRGAPGRGVLRSACRMGRGFVGRRWLEPGPFARRPSARRRNAFRHLSARIPDVPESRCSTSHPLFQCSSALHARALRFGLKPNQPLPVRRGGRLSFWGPRAKDAGRVAGRGHAHATTLANLLSAVERTQLLVHPPLRPPALQLVPRTHVDEPCVACQPGMDLADEAEHLLGDPAVIRVALGRRP